MDFFEVIGIVSEELNLGKPQQSACTLYQVTINKTDQIFIAENEEKTGILIYSFLFPVLNEYKNELSCKINELNRYGNITKTASISIDGDSFLLSEHVIFENFEKDSFCKRFKEFYNLVHYFKEKIPEWQIEILANTKKLQHSNKQIIQG